MPAPGDLLGKVDLAAEHKVALDQEVDALADDHGHHVGAEVGQAAVGGVVAEDVPLEGLAEQGDVNARPAEIHHRQACKRLGQELQKQVFEYLELLDGGKYTHAQLEEIIRFLQQTLCCRKLDIKDLEDADLVIYLRKKLNRPMRVCGMVKNVGEPGGGPFLAYNSDGTISLQILESSQIDMNDPVKKEMFEKGTHFNPVDLVCAVRDYKGNKFDLVKYVDKATGFISYKSKNGRELKALELPGLWNGAMSDWNTVFVEVPLSTFNPVKTVNDLLREQHQ